METTLNNWKQILEPHAQKVADIAIAIRDMPDDELDRFIAACHRPTQTNCWWAIKLTADVFAREAERERAYRRRVAS